MVSKIGKIPIWLPPSVTVEIKDGEVAVSGERGRIDLKIPVGIKVSLEQNQLIVSPEKTGEAAVPFHGLARTLIANAVQGVTRGWTKTLELVGTGYRCSLSGENLSLSVGFSHPVLIKPSSGIKFEVDQNKVTVLGINKEVVGQIAAQIRHARPPEPYKGKGIKYLDEKVRRKAGKAAKAVGSPAAK